MDLEARSLQPSMKATLLAKLREYKTERVTSANANITARDELLELGRIDSLAVYLLAILPRILIGVYLFELRV
jgi:vesicle transport through interaction with t-SNAREs 1